MSEVFQAPCSSEKGGLQLRLFPSTAHVPLDGLLVPCPAGTAEVPK